VEGKGRDARKQRELNILRDCNKRGFPISPETSWSQKDDGELNRMAGRATVVENAKR